MKRIVSVFIAIIVLFLIFPGCTYKLSLNGSQIPPNMKTIRVDFFENNAALVVNTLSQSFTEALKTRIRNTTRLSIVRGEADAVMSGSITDYTIAPASVEASSNGIAPIANQSRLTITVSVKYTNEANKKDNFNESFTKFANFSGDINTQEASLITEITKLVSIILAISLASERLVTFLKTLIPWLAEPAPTVPSATPILPKDDKARRVTVMFIAF